MKYLHKYRIYIFLSILALSTLACKKQLNVYPTTSIIDGNLITDSISAKAALNGVYYRFANGGTDFNEVPISKWFTIMELIPSELAGTVIYSSSDDGVYSYTFDTYTTQASTLWTYCYQIVNAANGFLKNIAEVSNISSNAKKEMVAEAKFLRAFANETLLLSYGQYYDTTSTFGIILRTEFVNAETLTAARSNVADCYKNILSDLDDAIADLPATNTAKIYTNRTAAQILKARVLINRGSAQDLSNVVSVTDDILNNTPFTLESSLKDIFYTKGLSSNEVVLGIQPYSNQNWKFYYLQYYGTYSAKASNSTLYKDDPRNTWYYADDQKGTIMGRNLGKSILEITKYYNGPVVNPVSTGNCEISYAFRLSEAYLYKAEALATLNQDLNTAKTLFSTVLKNAGFTDVSWVNSIQTSSQLRYEIIKEEIKNFMMENGSDWYALRRLSMGQIATIQPLLTSQTKMILPIPNSEITKNQKAAQNPGY